MDARRPCPDAALLAAFLDDALAEYERTAVVTHLAECAQCRSVALTVIEFREVQALDDLWKVENTQKDVVSPVTRVSRWTREKTRAPSWSGLRVAMITLLVLPLPSHIATGSARQALSRIFTAAAGQRPVEARLADDRSRVVRPFISGRSSSTSSLVFVAEHVRESYADSYDVPSRRAIGVAAMMTADLDSAVTSLSIAASAAPEDSQVANDLAAAFFERAQRLDRAEDLPAALSAAERALQLDPGSLQARFNRALIISALGLADTARDAWRDYLAHDSSSLWALEARQRRDAIEVANVAGPTWDALHRTLRSSNDPTTIVDAVDRSASRARELFEVELLGEWTAAASTRSAGDIVRRMRWVADALEAKTGDPFFADVATNLTELSNGSADGRSLALAAQRDLLAGLSFVKEQNGKAAEAPLRRGLAQLRFVGSPQALTATIELATSAYLQRNYGESARAAAAGKEAARRRGYLHLVARAAWIEGLAHVGLNDLAAARVAYEDMLASANTTGDAEHYVMANGLLAGLRILIGDSHEAWRHLVNALTRLHTCHNAVTLSNVLLMAGVQAMAANHFGAALLFQSRLLQAGVPLLPVAEIQLRTQRALALGQLDQLAAARAELENARALVTAVTDHESRARIAADLFAADAQIVQRHNPEEALRIAERGLATATPATDMFRRGRLLHRVASAALASGHLARAGEAVAASIAALQAYRSTPEASAMPASDFELPLYGEAIQIALRQGDMARAYEYSERRRSRRAVNAAAPIPPLHDVQRALPPDAAIVIVNHLVDVLHVWTIRRDGVDAHAVNLSRDRLANLLLSHLDEIARGASRPFKSGELYELMFSPIAAALHGVATLALVVDESFSQMAFAGLWDAKRDRFLVEDYRLVLAATAVPIMPRASRHPMPTADRFGIVEVSDRVSAGQSRREAAAADLFKLYGSAELRRGEAATPSRVLRQLSEMDVVHLAAPVVADPSNPGRWHIVVADEPGRKYSGSLSFADLARVNVRTRLVTLDPDLADRAVTSAEGTHSVARALVAAGVADVVGPIAPMPSAPYGEMWLEFHRQFVAGWSAVDSLRRAQLAALDLSHRRTGPWATLTVFSSTQ